MATGGFPKLRFWEDYFFFEKAIMVDPWVHHTLGIPHPTRSGRADGNDDGHRTNFRS
ncbi:protein of unknown function [Acidithiobacillus ferrivorans]|nr:protein of unknown function [Acidithiobacillus ferrivorans]